MFVIFLGGGATLPGLMQFGHNPYAFMFCAAMVFLCWGEIFSIFPATCADTFGSKFAAANAGTLYTAKGTASMLVPLASVLSAIGSWNAVFVAAAIVSILAALSAKFVLAPMRRRWIEQTAIDAMALEPSFQRESSAH
jgi:MFS transporter, OFA family, oxalate/formate antiporter